MQFYPTISRGELGPYVNCKRMLITTSSFANDEVKKYGKVRNDIFTPNIPSFVIDLGIDPGGYGMVKLYGDYRFTKEQYYTWLEKINPDWAATFDYCCESDITSDVIKRIHKTVDNAYFQCSIPSSWCWVPTIQGRELQEYLYCLKLLQPLLDEMMKKNDPRFRVGIGTLCRRNKGREIASLIHQIIREYPQYPYHFWGVKKDVFDYMEEIPHQGKSFDTAAWNGMYGKNREKWKNTEYRQREWCFKVALPEYILKLEKYIEDKDMLHGMEKIVEKEVSLEEINRILFEAFQHLRKIKGKGSCKEVEKLREKWEEIGKVLS